MTRETGFFTEIEEKAISENDDAFVFTGYAAVFNNRDLGNDIIAPGAFAESLKNHGPPLLLWNHKMDEAPVGTVVEAKEDKRGLWVKGELPKDDEFVRGRLVPQLKRRGLRGMSIGYRAEQSRKEAGARILTKIRLYEASFVNMPMNPEAGVETIKSDRVGIAEWKDYTDREREASLKARGYSDELAKRIVRLEREAQGTKGRREAGDEGHKILVPDFAGLITTAAQRL